MIENNEQYSVWKSKIENFCAYQERCVSDILKKMTSLKVDEISKSKIISELKEDQFIDERRYAMSFIRSKVNFKRDGINKIVFSLRNKGIPQSIIADVQSEIEQENYQQNIEFLSKKKWDQLFPKNEKAKAKQKLIQYLMGKGYRYDEFKTIVSKIA